ncbi:MAG: hypothetical protein WEA57_01380 [Acidimicrobiia bacterium]
MRWFWTAAANFRLLDAFDREQERHLANGGTPTPITRIPRRKRAVSRSYRPPPDPDPPKKKPAAPATV